MSLTPKKISESAVSSTYFVLPEHTNPMGNIFGGTIMSWIDMVAAVVAFRHCRSAVVTASIDQISFLHPVKLADLVTLKASVNFTSNRSVEVGVKVLAENPLTGAVNHTSTAYVTFVSLDENGKAQPLNPVICETEVEKRRCIEGEARYLENKKNR